IERKFLVQLLQRLELDLALASKMDDKTQWAELREALTARFMTQTREHWCGVFDGTDACVAPVLSMLEAPNHPHLRSRETFVSIDGIVQPAPAPRFSRTPPGKPHGPREADAATLEIALEGWVHAAEIEALFGAGDEERD
ncbi:MAG TPA: CoA transferase, partial [Burkholderiales bacterium]|nr:CoA transferase [Burkholderiales bacterium]